MLFQIACYADQNSKCETAYCECDKAFAKSIYGVVSKLGCPEVDPGCGKKLESTTVKADTRKSTPPPFPKEAADAKDSTFLFTRKVPTLALKIG